MKSLLSTALQSTLRDFPWASLTSREIVAGSEYVENVLLPGQKHAGGYNRPLVPFVMGCLLHK